MEQMVSNIEAKMPITPANRKDRQQIGQGRTGKRQIRGGSGKTAMKEIASKISIIEEIRAPDHICLALTSAI